MPSKRGFWVVLLTLLALFAVAIPSHSFAQSMASYVPPPPPPNGTSVVSGGTVPDACADGSDWQASANAAAQGSAGRLAAAQAAGALFPPININTQCLQNLMKMFSALPSADPAGLLGAVLKLVMTQVQALLNQVCSQVMGDINALKNAVMQMAKICIPMPSFGLNLGLGISANSCTGGTAFSLLAPSSAATSKYNANAFLSNQTLTTQQ